MPVAGVPLNEPDDDNVTPLGSVPVVTLKVGGGAPFAVTLKLPNVPTVKVVALVLVKAGGMASRVMVGPLPATASLVRIFEKFVPLTVP